MRERSAVFGSFWGAGSLKLYIAFHPTFQEIILGMLDNSREAN